MFALGMLRTLPSIENIVNPHLNIVYYIFMMISLFVACIVAAVAYGMGSK